MPSRVVKLLEGHGIKSNVRMRADSTPPVAELKFTDPDNVIVQIQDTSYCGGSGALGSRCANKAAPTFPGPPPIGVRTLNHFTIIVADVQRAVAFYQRVFGMRMQFNQGTEADWQKKVIPIVGIGKGPQFLAFAAGKDGGRIDHFCLGVGEVRCRRCREAVGSTRREGIGPDARRFESAVRGADVQGSRQHPGAASGRDLLRRRREARRALSRVVRSSEIYNLQL